MNGAVGPGRGVGRAATFVAWRCSDSKAARRSAVIFDPMTLPSDDNVNSYTFCVELKASRWFRRRGR
ncbi:hypothetical protein SMICM304S_01798 [Streptomyces microflavus]